MNTTDEPTSPGPGLPSIHIHTGSPPAGKGRRATGEDRHWKDRIKTQLAAIPEVTIERYCEAVFEVPGIEAIRVLDRRGEGNLGGGAVFTLMADDGGPYHTIEQMIVNRSGKGRYDFAAVARGQILSHRVFWCGPAFGPGETGPGAPNYKARLAEVMEAKAAIVTLKELDKLEKGSDDEMKTDDFLKLWALMQKGNSGGSSDELAKILSEQNRLLVTVLTDRRGSDASLVSALAPFALKALDLPFVRELVRGLLRGGRVTTPAPGGGILDTLSGFLTTPTGKALLESMGSAIAAQGQRLAPAGAPRLIPAAGMLTNADTAAAATPLDPTASDREAATPSAEGGTPTMPVNAEEIVNALLTELARPERNVQEIAAFLEGINLPDGSTLLQRIEPMSRTSDALARIGLRQLDARLVDGPVWEGVRELLAFVRQASTEERRDG